MNIMDYSMLIGIHDMERENTGDPEDQHLHIVRVRTCIVGKGMANIDQVCSRLNIWDLLMGLDVQARQHLYVMH